MTAVSLTTTQASSVRVGAGCIGKAVRILTVMLVFQYSSVTYFEGINCYVAHRFLSLLALMLGSVSVQKVERDIGVLVRR